MVLELLCRMWQRGLRYRSLVEPFYLWSDETPEIIFVVNDQVIIELTASELESKKTTQHYFSRIGYNASVVAHTIMISKTAYPTFQGKAYRMSSINGPTSSSFGSWMLYRRRCRKILRTSWRNLTVMVRSCSPNSIPSASSAKASRWVSNGDMVRQLLLSTRDLAGTLTIRRLMTDPAGDFAVSYTNSPLLQCKGAPASEKKTRGRFFF